MLVGVQDDGSLVGAQIGTNTLEHFANRLAAESDPTLFVSMETKDIERKKVVTISVGAARQGEIYYTFGRPLLRIGRTNQIMGPHEQRARLLSGQVDWSEERDRPRFDLPGASFTNRSTEFELQRKIKRVTGDYMAVIEWRFRGPKLQPPMEWRQANGASFGSYTLSAKFSKSQPLGKDELILDDQLGIEVRFHWRGKWRSEVHRYQFTGWEVGREVLPPIYTDE